VRAVSANVPVSFKVASLFCLALQPNEEFSVPVCDACDAFMERVTQAKPHPALIKEGAQRIATGTLEKFQCRECGIRWQRFHTNALYRGKPQFWKIIGRAGHLEAK
jgi:hypothetical protein